MESQGGVPIPLLIVDAHVHIHDCYDLPGFLQAAFSNFLRAAREAGRGGSHIPVLLLAEGRKQRAFQRISDEMKRGTDRIAEDESGIYRAFPTEEPESIRIEHPDGAFLILVSGRQIVTAERLEVLALSAVSGIPDGLSLEEAVAAVEKAGAIPVIPWGFGKWIGRRGEVLGRFLKHVTRPGIFLGDNGGRPAFLPEPPQFSLGRERGIRILPGSDPLPFPSETGRPGSFGFTLRCSIDPCRPAIGIRETLFDPASMPEPYGRLETPLRFLQNQIAMQVTKFLKQDRSRETT